jgi:hypothetical protein
MGTCPSSADGLRGAHMHAACRLNAKLRLYRDTPLPRSKPPQNSKLRLHRDPASRLGRVCGTHTPYAYIRVHAYAYGLNQHAISVHTRRLAYSAQSGTDTGASTMLLGICILFST